MEAISGMPRPELLQVSDAVAREKGIDRNQILSAMEKAIEKAARFRYGHENDIRAHIDRKTGEIRIARYIEVTENISNSCTQISLKKAQERQKNIKIGEFLFDILPPIDFGRVAGQTAKQVIIQKVRDAERARQFDQYKNQIGEAINGLVKRIEFGNIIVDLGRAEALIRREELIPREIIREGHRIRAVILNVNREQYGPQIFLSRTHPNFLKKLFFQEVPEIYDGIIEIKSVARDPGSRAKIAVLSFDQTVDPIGACVGIRGSRVQSIVSELQGEKIDIIQWSENNATFVVNALAPAEVSKVVLDEEINRIEVVVPNNQLSLAIGRRGQNVRLASQLTQCDIDIMTEDDDMQRRQEESQKKISMFIKSLDVDEVIAHLLVVEGFRSIEEIAYVPITELAEIEGFEEEIATELRQRARTFLSNHSKSLDRRVVELKIQDDIINFTDLPIDITLTLAEKNIKNLAAFADLASDELIEHIGNTHTLTMEKANALIIKAREKLGWIDKKDTIYTK